jgi:carbon-monoxide dehydrogenase medium subunit
MKPAPFEYHDPQSKSEVLALLAAKTNSRLLAGGQSLVPMLNFRLASPDHLIDINRVEALRGIAHSGGIFVLGAMTRQCEIEFSDELRAALPILREAIIHVGHRQTRNRGTLGGSLCHLDPSAELVTAAMALDATLIAESSKGARRITIADWGRGYLTNALSDDEMLTSVELPVWPAGHGYAFVEYARRHGDFAIVAVAVLMTLDTQGAIDRVAIAVGGCAASPVRLTQAESALKGNKPSIELFKSTARLASSIDALSDPYVKADYREHLARVLTERALGAAAKRARTGIPQ